MSNQNGSAPRERPSSPRAVDPNREHSADQAVGLSESAGTLQSSRAELAYRDWNAVPESDRPLPKACGEAAKAVDTILHARSMRGDMGSSNEALARACGVDEKGIRQWRKNDKRIPLAALLLMPASVSVEIIQWVAHRRGLGRPAATPLGQLDDALTAVEKSLSADCKPAIKAARGRILAMLDRLDEETR